MKGYTISRVKTYSTFWDPHHSQLGSSWLGSCVPFTARDSQVLCGAPYLSKVWLDFIYIYNYVYIYVQICTVHTYVYILYLVHYIPSTKSHWITMLIHLLLHHSPSSRSSGRTCHPRIAASAWRRQNVARLDGMLDVYQAYMGLLILRDKLFTNITLPAINPTNSPSIYRYIIYIYIY